MVSQDNCMRCSDEGEDMYQPIQMGLVKAVFSGAEEKREEWRLESWQ